MPLQLCARWQRSAVQRLLRPDVPERWDLERLLGLSVPLGVDTVRLRIWICCVEGEAVTRVVSRPLSFPHVLRSGRCLLCAVPRHGCLAMLCDLLDCELSKLSYSQSEC